MGFAIYIIFTILFIFVLAMFVYMSRIFAELGQIRKFVGAAILQSDMEKYVDLQFQKKSFLQTK